jgi:hydroxyacylglutathione hydrolase
MKIDCLVLGSYQTNCYVLREGEEARDCLVIDPGLGAGRLTGFLKDSELNPVGIVLTHGHVDHIAGISALRLNYPEVKLHIHKLDSHMLTEPQSNLSAMMGGSFTTKAADFLLDENHCVEQAGLKLEVLHTPGHTPGGICLYARDQGVVFTDDTLFADSIGRTDFPGGGMGELLESIRDKLFTLPEETVVYPGHGPTTTIGCEKMHNPFLR